MKASVVTQPVKNMVARERVRPLSKESRERARTDYADPAEDIALRKYMECLILTTTPQRLDETEAGDPIALPGAQASAL
jgi:hypothetical protein